MDDDIYIKQITGGMGEHLDLWNADSSMPNNKFSINLFGSLLPSQEASKWERWGSLEDAYPQVYRKEESAEYLRKLDEGQKRCDAIVAKLPKSSSAAAAASNRHTYREYIARLPPPKPKPPTLKLNKPADPTKLAAAQARFLAQQQKQKAVATSADAAAVLTKTKTKQGSFSPKTSSKIKLKVIPAKKTATAKLVSKTTAAAAPKTKKTTATKRVSKIEHLRPKPLAAAAPRDPVPSTGKNKMPPLASLTVKPLTAMPPRAAEKKTEKTTAAAVAPISTGGSGDAVAGVVSKHPKTPTIKEMLNEMLTRHKNVVLVQPLQKLEELVSIDTDNPGLNGAVDGEGKQPKMKEAFSQGDAGDGRKKVAKKREREDQHSEGENKPHQTINAFKLKTADFTQPQQQLEKKRREERKVAVPSAARVVVSSPMKPLKFNQTTTQKQTFTATAPSSAPLAAPPAAVPPTTSSSSGDLFAALDALAAPFAQLSSILDNVNSIMSSPSSTTFTNNEENAAKKLAQAKATAQRMSRLSAEKRQATQNGKDTHVSIMFDMHGGIALLQAAITMEMNLSCQTVSTSIKATTAARAAAAAVYDQAAAVLEASSARSATATGPELTISTIQTFTQRTAACARLRGAILKNDARGGAGAGGGAGSQSWKGIKYTSKASMIATVAPMHSPSAPLFEKLFNTFESTAAKVDCLQQLAIKEKNLAASRAAMAMRLMAGEVVANGQPRKLWALIDACKASIMKI